MDADYARNEAAPAFRQALFVLATVMSTAQPGVAVLDAGLKALAMDSGLPLVWQRPRPALCRRFGRARQLACGPGDAPALGEKLLLVPGHC